jgi:uncharacterized protein YceK
MKKLLFILIILLILVGCGEKSGILSEPGAEPGFVQTIYQGKCVMDDVPLWNMPGSIAEGAEQTATLTGTCQGASVLIIQYVICKDTGRYWYEVKQGEKKGWVTSSFVVKEVNKVVQSI